jgi:hypothetical protein
VQHRLIGVRFVDHSLTAAKQNGLLLDAATRSVDPPSDMRKMIVESVDAYLTNIATVPILQALVRPGNALDPRFPHCSTQVAVSLVKSPVEC